MSSNDIEHGTLGGTNRQEPWMCPIWTIAIEILSFSNNYFPNNKYYFITQK
jgi:hypothetical protein